LRRELDSQEPPAKLRANGGGRPRSAEWIDHKISGVRAATDNAAKELHGELRGHSLDPLAVCPGDSRNDPYVVEDLALRVGTLVVVLLLPVALRAHGGPIERELMWVVYHVEQVSLGPVEFAGAVHAEGLVPRDP
jgi:hypothetical protein